MPQFGQTIDSFSSCDIFILLNSSLSALHLDEREYYDLLIQLHYWRIVYSAGNRKLVFEIVFFLAFWIFAVVLSSSDDLGIWFATGSMLPWHGLIYKDGMTNDKNYPA